ncbi:hypothetical protein U14_02831 [Candidatus Moduliflexus flocculans]|uniref:DUF454 domain-containing protein n=1 Tax=Candidatus Moduliflexus flocculans TaxID=1499966 RepID=A0A081BMH0_9BACT|nr:hypothetical protein U14_02831 [Candidatus Moduliflexus flocculans]
MKPLHSLKNAILIVIGSLAVGLGVAGIFLPLLPTTPFLLLAAVCYANSSERFYHWLLHHQWFGSYIRNYREGRGIPLISKVVALVLLWLTIGTSALFVVPVLIGKIVLVAIAIGVTIHLLSVKTFKEEVAVITEKIEHSERV